MIGSGFDIILLIILLVSLILGLVKGFVRQIVGLAAVVVGLLLAVRYYHRFSGIFGGAFASEKWAHLIAFVIIFVVVLLVGALLSFLLKKLICGPLRFVDHVLGGVLGLVQGVLICGVIVMALLVFPVKKEILMRSTLAPYCYWLTKGMVQIIPQELKNQFNETYKEIVEGTGQHGEKI
jgi:membrane protein required for colicin V production